MKKLITISIALYFSLNNIFAQDSLSYYFKDDGLANINSHVSIDVTDLLDATVSIEYQYYNTDIFAIIFGGAYSFDKGIPHDVSVFYSITSGLFNKRTQGFYPPSSWIPSSEGIEIWTGLSTAKRYTRRSSFDVHIGYLNYGFYEHRFNSIFTDLNYGIRFINKDRFFIRIEFQSRFHLFSHLDNVEMFGDFVFGFGIKLGIKN